MFGETTDKLPQAFGPPPKDHATGALPQHGFARNSTWEYLGSSSSESGALSKGGDDSVKLDFGLSAANLSDEHKKAWPYEFGLVYTVTLGKDGLQTMLNVRNQGKEPFEFQMLLHTYFKVDVSNTHHLPARASNHPDAAANSPSSQDVTTLQINGLGSVTYTDKVLNATEHTQTDPALAITGETDRVYKSIKQDTTSVLQGGKPRFDVTRDNLEDTVVWNPWVEKNKAMADLHDGAYKNFVCVEVGAVNGWQRLEAGETFEGGMIVKSHL